MEPQTEMDEVTEGITTDNIITATAEAPEHPLDRVSMAIQRWWLPILVPVGLVGNILSLLVMLQKQNRQLSVCIYLAALSIIDTLMLCIGGQYWLVVIQDMPDTGGGETLCRVMTWIFQFISLTGIFLILAMTADRVFAICLPHRSKQFCTTGKAKIVTLIIMLITPFYSLPHLFASGIISNRAAPVCVAFRYTNTFLKAYSWVNTSLNSVVPFLLLIIMNSLIIHTLRNRKLAIQPADEAIMTETERRRIAIRRSIERQLTVMLLLISFTLLVLTLPLYIRYILIQFVDISSDPDLHSIYLFLAHFTNKLYYTNNAVNFYLYCIAGSKFRRDLKKLFRSRCKCFVSKVEPISVSKRDGTYQGGHNNATGTAFVLSDF